MKRTALAAATALLLTACTTAGPRIAGTPLDPLNPQISVVTGNTGANYIIVNQDPIVVTTKGKSRITWTLVTPGFEFDPKRGIEITKSGISGQLTGCRSVTSTQFACDNNNSGKARHTYDINLVRSGGGPLKVDPSFVND